MKRFEEIYAENYQAVFRAAQKMLGDSDDVSDIVQDVFVQLFTDLKKGVVFLHPKSWLYRVTMNKSVDFIRKQKRIQRIDTAGEITTTDQQERVDDIHAVRIALAVLNPNDRKLAVLYSEGLSYKEISEASGVKLTSVGKSLSRALKKLEQELKNQNYELY